MAAEPKKSPSGKLYGKSMKIADKDEEMGGPAGGGEAPPAPKAEPKSESKEDKGPKEDVMAGTEGIEVHQQHSAERTEMHHRHMREHDERHHRHEREHLMRATGHHKESMAEMHDRHHRETREMHTRHEREMRDLHERHEEAGRGEGPTGGIREKSVGKEGTEPK